MQNIRAWGRDIGCAIIRSGEFHELTDIYPIADNMTPGVPFKLDSVCEVIRGSRVGLELPDIMRSELHAARLAWNRE